MNIMPTCSDCGRSLTGDEIGLYRKMVNRGAEKFLCISCLAIKLRCEETALHERIEYFRAQGCTLFSTASSGVRITESKGEQHHER